MSENLVFISGASSGIGLGLARTVPFDARIVDISRRGTESFEHVAADLSSPEGWQAATAAFEKEIPDFPGERVIFCHCAGTLRPMGYSGEVDAREYARGVLLNSAAPQILGDAFLRAARRTSAEAVLILISSGAAQNVYEGWTAYGAGKAAVNQWVRVAGAEQVRRKSRCRVLAVSPGIVATAMQAEIREMSAHDFPDVGRFVDLYVAGSLRDPLDAARDIWGLLDEELPNGAVIDLRDREAG